MITVSEAVRLALVGLNEERHLAGLFAREPTVGDTPELLRIWELLLNQERVALQLIYHKAGGKGCARQWNTRTLKDETSEVMRRQTNADTLQPISAEDRARLTGGSWVPTPGHDAKGNPVCVGEQWQGLELTDDGHVQVRRGFVEAEGIGTSDTPRPHPTQDFHSVHCARFGFAPTETLWDQAVTTREALITKWNAELLAHDPEEHQGQTIWAVEEEAAYRPKTPKKPKPKPRKDNDEKERMMAFFKGNTP